MSVFDKQGGVAATVVVIEGVLNRETRDSLSAAERSYLNESFQYTGGGLALTALAARGLFRSGFAVRMMAANPCRYHGPFIRHTFTDDFIAGVVLGVSLVGSIGSMMGVYYTSPENTVQKHLFWLVRCLASSHLFSTN